MNSCRSCNIKISLAGRRNKSNTNHYPSDDTEDRSNVSTNKTFIFCDYDGWPQICTKEKFTQCTQIAKHRKVAYMNNASQEIWHFTSWDRFNFSVQALEILAFVYSYFNLPAKQHVVESREGLGASTQTPQSPHDDQILFDNFLCSHVTFPKKWPLHFLHNLKLFLCVGLSAAEAEKLGLFFAETGEQECSRRH
jgi:hypothetical protein